MSKNQSPFGTLYVLSNPAMPGIIKIGFTEKQSAKERAAELSKSTSVPLPFVIEDERLVENPLQYERLVHARLDKHRLSKDKEFFRIDAWEASQVINEVVFGDRTIDLLRELKYQVKLFRQYPEKWKWNEEIERKVQQLEALIAEQEATSPNANDKC